MTIKRLLTGWVLLVVLGCSSATRAAPGETNRGAQQEARKRVLAGQQALRAKRYQKALEHFKAANRLWPRKENWFNLALVLLEMGKKAQAATHLLQYLKRAGPNARRTLPALFKQLLKQVGTLRVRATWARAEIWIDGHLAGRGEVAVGLLPGRHSVELRQGGDVLVQSKMDVSAGQEIQWNPKQTEPRRRTARRVNTTGTTADHKRPRKRLHWAYFAAAAGLALVAGVAIIPVGLKTRSLEDQWQSNPTLEVQAEGRRYKAATNALIGITASAAVAAVMLGIFTRWRSKKFSERVTIFPAVAPRGAAINVRLAY